MPLEIRKQAICPENEEHDQFITTAHEMHSWVVDSKGNFVKDLGCEEVSSNPDPDNIWRCKECGTVAVFKEA